MQKIFEELKIATVYTEYEEKAVGDIKEKIAKVDQSEGLKPAVFDAFLKKIYKRSK